MNEADKAAFEKWWLDHGIGDKEQGWKDWQAALAHRNAAALLINRRVLNALKGVIRVADRATDEFEEARAAVIEAETGL